MAGEVRCGKEKRSIKQRRRQSSPPPPDHPSCNSFLCSFPAKFNRSYLRQRASAYLWGKQNYNRSLARAFLITPLILFRAATDFNSKGGAGRNFGKFKKRRNGTTFPARNDSELKCKLMRRHFSHNQFWDRPSRNPLSS